VLRSYRDKLSGDNIAFSCAASVDCTNAYANARRVANRHTLELTMPTLEWYRSRHEKK
jgi:hypothetical protein